MFTLLWTNKEKQKLQNWNSWLKILDLLPEPSLFSDRFPSGRIFGIFCMNWCCWCCWWAEFMLQHKASTQSVALKLSQRNLNIYVYMCVHQLKLASNCWMTSFSQRKIRIFHSILLEETCKLERIWKIGYILRFAHKRFAYKRFAYKQFAYIQTVCI